MILENIPRILRTYPHQTRTFLSMTHILKEKLLILKSNIKLSYANSMNLQENANLVITVLMLTAKKTLDQK